MVISCAAFGCTNRYVKGGPKSFHYFPMKNEELLKKWIVAIKRENFNPTKYSCLCSDHFLPSDYNLNRSENVFPVHHHKPILKFNAVPSVFIFSKEKKKIRKPPLSRKPPPVKGKKRNSDDDMSTIPAKSPKLIAPDVEDLSSTISTEVPSIVHKDTTNSPTKEKLRRKVKTLQQKLRRKEKKINSMQDIISQLKDKNLLCLDAATVINDNFTGLSSEIIRNQFENQNVESHGHRYSDEIKKFSLTLNFYSPKAYNFLRPILSLPAPSSISNWTSSVKCEPGIFVDVLKNLEEKQNHDRNFKYCGLVVDAMAIKNNILYDKSTGKYVGFTDYGKDLVINEPDTPATEALVFMLVGLCGHWKTPIGYVLCNKIKTVNLTSFIKLILNATFTHNIHVKSITFDGANVNLNSVVALGCKFGPNAENFVCHFDLNDTKIHVVPDVCHMLKLARNALNSLGCFVDFDGRQIKWEFIQKLYELQEEEGLRFGNKLSSKHVQFMRHKMNVKIAAQTLSNSVADGIEFLMNSSHPSFQGAEGTITFIRTIDKLFDLLNSRSAFGKSYKSPLRLKNAHLWKKYFEESIDYLSKLTDATGVPLLMHRRKTFVLGLIVASKSIQTLSHELLTLAENPFNYVLTYKFSQDHLELLFACIRSKSGFNDNADVGQFKSSLKRILLRNSIVASKSANCVTFDDHSHGSVFSLKWKRRISPIDTNRQLSLELQGDDFDEINLFCGNFALTFFKEAILTYIAGFIVRKLLKVISCKTCAGSLLNQSFNEHSYSLSTYSLINSKNRGGLVVPSNDVSDVVKICEKVFRFNVSGESLSQSKISKDNNLKLKLILNVNKVLDKNIFSNLNSHDVQTASINEDIHSTQLVKNIAAYFFDIRLARYAQDFNEFKKKSSIGLRQQSKKLVQFKGL